VDKCVENLVDNSQNKYQPDKYWDINIFIIYFFERFPHFFAEKRYKLINFAPDLEIVDKVS
jgi:hypothetical protein